MKLTERTLTVLKNFASINNGLIIKEGSDQRTVSLTRDILAEATLDQEFPREVPIYDLNGFLSMLSTFDESGEADIEFADNHMMITRGKRRMKYFYASPEVIFSAPDDLELDKPEDRFALDIDDLKLIQKMASYGLGDMTIKSNGKKIDLVVTSSETGSANELQIEVDSKLPKCNVTFDVGLMKVIPAEYDIGVNESTVYLSDGEDETRYWIVVTE
jgi:hypothetical protein